MGELGRRRYPATGSEYLLLEEVGQGASAIVYKARCLRYNDIVAVKILDLERCNSNLDDVCREVQTTSLIDHPNVLSSHCSFVVDRFLWVVTPYMADGSFLHIMKSAYPDGFEEPVIATILRETLKAIVYLHSHGHIHRDVKAGNILVDSNGAIKLGDFGVSAGMFDTGVRQRARKTFVGTPCWMAPEVMEQLHGYDFKADIWSFAITALELAHGHAPFSKYPPIKVLLMTLQNAPPGLDYARDKRFSKAFKEMVAICLAKDPARRPSAEKLLRHSFFKRAKSAEYLAQTILTGLSPLGQRLRDLTIKDEENLAQKMMPSREKEEISQSEYNRGISGWNFNVEDLKAQAALIPDDDDYSPTSKEGTELPNSNSNSNKIQSSADIKDHLQPSAPVSSKQIPVDKSVSPLALPSLTTDSLNADECTTGVRPIILRSPIQETSTDFSRDKVMLSVNGRHKFAKETELEINKGTEVDKDEQLLKQKEIKDFRRQRVEATGRCAVSGPLDPEYVLAGYGGQSEVAEKDRSGCSGFDECLGSSFNKGSMSSGNITAHAIPRQYRSLNGIIGLMNPLAGHKDGLEKVNSVHRKGRFSVTSEDVDLVEDIVPSRSIPKSASAQAFPQLNLARNYSTTSSCNLLSESVVPHLQNILQQSIAQKDSVITLMNLLNLGEVSNASFSSIPLGSKDISQSSDVGISNSLVASASDPDKDQSQQVAELQKRVADLLEELQREKLKNVSLQCQLNAMYSKEEEKV